MQDGLADIHKLRPLARLGKDDWSTVGEVLTIPLMKYSNWSAFSANFAVAISPGRKFAPA
jgi:hypothetical protein